MMELDEINPESTTPRPKNLEDSQDLLAESCNNLSSSKGSEDIEPYIITKNKRKKGRNNFFNDFKNLFNEIFGKAKIKNKIFIIFGLIITIVTLFIKFYIFCVMLYYLIKRIKIFHSFVFERILDKGRNSYFLYIINYFFLLFGFIILFIEMFCQFNIRYRTLLTINECSLKSLILSKCLYFISLGLVPEVIFATVPFKSKKNVFLSFFKMKLTIQPYIIIILVIYTIYTILRRSEETKKERIIQEIKYIQDVVNEFVNKYVFLWNNFDEKTIYEKEKENKEKTSDNKDKNDNDDNNINNDSKEIIKENTLITLKKQNSLHTLKRRKRKGSKDENENKTRYQKLFGKIDEDENEEGEELKVLGFIRKFKQYKDKASLFFTDNIFVRIKKYLIIAIIGFFLCSPVINGIFGYGYYVFYESDVYHLFQIELLLCFAFGFILILLTEE